MQSPGGVDEDHIHIPGPGSLDSVVDHGRGVSPLVLADNGSAAAPRPDFQLIRRGSPEGISRHQQHVFPLIHKLLGDFPDGSGLAHTVDPDDQDHTGLGGKIQLRVSHVQHIHQDILQSGLCFLGCFQVLLTNGLPKSLHRFSGGFHPQIRENQALLQFVIKIIVNLRKTGKYTAQGVAEGIPGLCHSGLDFIKKSHKTPPSNRN